MNRPMLSVTMAFLIVLAGSVCYLLVGCRYPVTFSCDESRKHPGHLNEYGEPDPCCLSNVPCCANPLWGRKVVQEGREFEDPCCFAIPCPFWDVNEGADAGTDDAATDMKKDASTSPEMDAGTDAAGDGGP